MRADSVVGSRSAEERDRFVARAGWRRYHLLATLLLLAVFASPLRAQDDRALQDQELRGPALQGRVVDTEGRPVSGIPVTLHHVTEGGGSEVGRALSDQEGRFVIEPGATLAGGVYFAATRFDGALYMGTPFRTFGEVPEDYRIVIGGDGIVGGAAIPGPVSAERGQGWGVLLFFGLVGLAAVVVPLRRARRGPLAYRTILTELAELEERQAALSPQSRQAMEGEYREQRAALRARLKELTSVPVHAADNH